MKLHTLLGILMLALAFCLIDPDWRSRAGIPLDLGIATVIVLGLAWILWWYLRRKRKLSTPPPPSNPPAPRK